MTATYQHGVFGARPVDFDEAIRLLRKVTEAYREVLEAMLAYDEEHPELWADCHEHPGEDCGYRDVPDFYLHACITECDIRDAEAFLKAVES
jgi:hypothetical protein